MIDPPFGVAIAGPVRKNLIMIRLLFSPYPSLKSLPRLRYRSPDWKTYNLPWDTLASILKNIARLPEKLLNRET
jgi:hypothetical protein